VVLCLRCRARPGRSATALLPTVTAKSLFRASLVLNKQTNDYARVIDCYIRDEDPAFRALVFGYINEVIAKERAAALAVRRAGEGDSDRCVGDWGGAGRCGAVAPSGRSRSWWRC
jgi:hypothetical protein